MKVYKTDDLEMIPMAMNAFFFNIPLGSHKIIYANTISIGEEFLNRFLEYINDLDTDKYIIVDMESVDYAFRLFEKFQKVTRPILFVNINTQTLREKLKENIPNLQFSDNERNASLNINYDLTIDNICSKYSSRIAKGIYVNIVKGLIDGIPRNPILPQKLDSSGLYSNMYVNVKRLFLYPEEYYAIVYGLAKKIVDSKIEYDGFISSSKNGALLANILGMMLNKKIIHIMGVGPKYSMNVGNLQKEIKKGKNYIYVFDFRCTGTEMKVLSALVNANDAYIQGSVGIAIYKSDIVDKNLLYLVDIHNEDIPYKIAGDENDIIRLMERKD